MLIIHFSDFVVKRPEFPFLVELGLVGIQMEAALALISATEKASFLKLTYKLHHVLLQFSIIIMKRFARFKCLRILLEMEMENLLFYREETLTMH